MGRVKKELKPIEKCCEFCGNEFIAYSGSARYCPDHKGPKVREKLMAEMNNKPNAALLDYLRKINEYNKKHGSCLSYGKYEEKVVGK